MSKFVPVLVAFALTANPLSAKAGPVTYDFTGTVTFVGGGPYAAVPLGATVTGTYTFDPQNGDPSLNYGTLGSQSTSWAVEDQSGSQFGSPASSRYVFSSTATVAGIHFSTGSPGAYANYSHIIGLQQKNLLYFASDGQNADANTGSYSSLSILQSSRPAFTSDGLPTPFTDEIPGNATGMFSVAVPSTHPGYTTDIYSVQYNLTSLTVAPVRLPATVWLLLTGFAGLGTVIRKPLVG